MSLLKKEPLPTSKTITVISFNVFGAPFYAYKVLQYLFRTNVYKRLAYLADYLSNSDADIVNLQEVNTYGQYLFLKKRVRGYKYAYYKPFIFSPKGGVVIFSKLPFRETRYINFTRSGSVLNKSFIAGVMKRGLLVGFLKDMPLCVINTHLTHNTDHNWSSENRYMKFQKIQLDQIIMYLRGLESQSNSILLAGDFNVPKSANAFNQFVKEAKLTDIFEEHHTTTYHEQYTFKESKLGRVDHLLLLPNKHKIRILEKKHLFDEQVTLKSGKKIHLSDHMGLYAKLEIKY